MMQEYGKLFSKVPVGSRIAPNVLVANPVEFNDGLPDGSPSESTTERYFRLAEGQWGIVIMESTTASDDPSLRCVGKNGLLLNNTTFDAFKSLIHEFKRINPAALVFIQLSTGSCGYGDSFEKLTTEDIQLAQESLISSCILAIKAGFDGLDFKQCHEFLPHRLLTRRNFRKDIWGGKTLKQRARFFSESISKIKTEKKKHDREDFIIGTRISENDLNELHEIVKYFDDELKLDYINVSASPSKFTFDHTVVFILSQAVKLMNPKMKVIGSGYTGYLSQGNPIAMAQEQMSRRFSPDLIGFGRQTIADPFLPQKLMSGDPIHWCKRCDSCLGILHKQLPIYCKSYHPSE
jgi:2,4-dienoyl-CoA reductase-like NADH-dependent reductase (Old Yellow Enzyme family)